MYAFQRAMNPGAGTGTGRNGENGQNGQTDRRPVRQIRQSELTDGGASKGRPA